MKTIIFKQSEEKRVMVTLSHLFKALNPKKSYELVIKENRKSRSLDANAYMWVLLDKLAEALSIKKEDLYIDFIKNMGGVSEHYCGTPQAVQKLVTAWRKNGIGWQSEVYPSKLEGMQNVTLYYGSSSFDTEQMSRLIDLVIQDCKQLDIETKTPNEIARLVTEWGE